MMVTFISQCEKQAVNRSRRVLDSFAERIGNNTWQTVITLEGLKAVRKLLRKYASRHTAVSCHWIRSRARSELVWVVGNQKKFDTQGRIPVNTTQKNLLHTEWENSWLQAQTIQILAVLAALLHDVGKATPGFQKKLTATNTQRGDPYRHEWISLRLFEAMIAGCQTDIDWLTRLASFDTYRADNPDWLTHWVNDTQTQGSGFGHFPPIAQCVAWLIVTHHRLPFYEHNYFDSDSRQKLQHNAFLLKPDMAQFYAQLTPVNGWVKNQKACDERTDVQQFWQLKAMIFASRNWQKMITRWANKALNHAPLMAMQQQRVSNPLLMHLARLCLMVGDHNYSSLAIDDSKQRVKGDPALNNSLFANTDKNTRRPKQALDEHLLGVAALTARFARLLPQLSHELPAIVNHPAFSKRTANLRFQWQNSAYDNVKKHQQAAQENGFFAVNIASTGCGKTLGNARVMAALADPGRGVRFTIALGLRVLTLQTGQALREKLALDETSLAILVGGAANRRLFTLNQEQREQSGINSKASNHGTESSIDSEAANHGAESAETLVKDSVNYESCAIDVEELGTIVADSKARDLLFAPVVSCTVDHIIDASENSRGGRHIAPMLRLLTSDLILDEPDDFDPADLPALSRLVHLAGMLGSRVLLSSATLTPDLVTGLFTAYQRGRTIWHRNHSPASGNIVCAWIDEFKQVVTDCATGEQYASLHNAFVNKRVKKLRAQPPRITASVLPLNLPAPDEGEKLNNKALAATLMQAAQRLHNQHALRCSKTHKRASVGLMRLANIRPLHALASAIYNSYVPSPDVQIHLCCYHAQQLLALRNSLETTLDRLLNRSTTTTLFDHSEIRSALHNSTATEHLFIVLATPVAEVGRDHDYDWAIIEPSSMRSIIQSAGRVWRHRPDKIIGHVLQAHADNNHDASIAHHGARIAGQNAVKTPDNSDKKITDNHRVKCSKAQAKTAAGSNVIILDCNIKALEAGADRGVRKVIFTRPGFEDKRHLLQSHDISTLISADQLASINAIARIQKPDALQPATRLADLEHAVMADLLNNDALNVVNSYWQDNSACQANVHLQRISPFRLQQNKQVDYVCFPDDDYDTGYRFRFSEQTKSNAMAGDSANSIIRYQPFISGDTAVKPWLVSSVQGVLEQLAQQEGRSLSQVALDYATVTLDENASGWYFHPWFGFWKRAA